MSHATPEARRASNRAYAARRHAQGRGTDCRGGPVDAGHVLGDDCRYAQRVYRYGHDERTRLHSVRQPPVRRHHDQWPAFRVLWTMAVRLQ